MKNIVNDYFTKVEMMRQIQLLFFLFITTTTISFAQRNIAFLDADVTHTAIVKNKNFTPHSTNFQIIEGMMLVQAVTNNKIGNFIIDTGSPVLVINSQSDKGFKVKAKGISNTLESREILINQFSWSGIQKKGITAYTLDISHLEAASGKKIAGIIGFDILKDYEMVIDYPNQKLELLPIKKRKKKQTGSPIATIPFDMQAHLPVIKIKIGDKKMRLALDTGSEVNVLHDGLRNKISDDLITTSFKEEIQGVDKIIKVVEAVRIQSTEIKKLPFDNMKYVFTDLSHLKTESNLYIDGILGYPLLKNGKFSINYREQKLYVWRLDGDTL